MAAPGENLVVRQHERHTCALDAQVSVSPEFAERIQLARSVGSADGRIAATATDVSRGGMGLRSATFFPKHGQLMVRLPGAPTSGGGGAWEVLVRVERVSMIDRGPTYYLGTSFCAGEGQDRKVEALLAGLRQSAPAGGPGTNGNSGESPVEARLA